MTVINNGETTQDETQLTQVQMSNMTDAGVPLHVTDDDTGPSTSALLSTDTQVHKYM